MGVKSLWTLLAPVGRPVMLETVEGKVMAIDSSIWLYQFQATMRDKDGHGLVNAHVLGFLRRISKLLFYGIKPVFVFDGGAPALKRTTLNDRKRKKAGAASNHLKLAEKLLSAQMRREALKQASGGQHEKKGKGKEVDIPLDDDTVYFEDLESPPKQDKKASPRKEQPKKTSSTQGKFLDHDPYRLPEVDVEQNVTKATRSVIPDSRLATEEELRRFIEDMRPEDFDVTSPSFRELPTEIQYEIVGDLRLKSRQTSYVRLQKMLSSAKTPLDFSKQQIQNLRQRNVLTQQLLTTTDSIGSAHIAIPVRIASERNKEYILLKNEGPDGGWVLGIKDIGTKEKPITIDHEVDASESSEDSDFEMEEVIIEDKSLSLAGTSFGAPQQEFAEHYVDVYRDDLSQAISSSLLDSRSVQEEPSMDHETEDELLAYAIQQSLDHRNKNATLSDDTLESAPSLREDDVNDPAINPTAAPFIRNQSTQSGPSLFGAPIALLPLQKTTVSVPLVQNAASRDGGEPIEHAAKVSSPFSRPAAVATTLPDGDEIIIAASTTIAQLTGRGTPPGQLPIVPQSAPEATLIAEQPQSPQEPESDQDMEEILPANEGHLSVDELFIENHASEPRRDSTLPLSISPVKPLHTPLESIIEPPSIVAGDATGLFTISRSPSPSEEILTSLAQLPAHEEDWDAAEEMDLVAEEGEFAHLMAQVKGKSVDEMRREVDDEISQLNKQRTAAMRDSEDITQQMIAQIMTMLRLFGIPYITAPMEAEAQCAELANLNLVDGVITDDSDVFLFGAPRVFKNMFNQSKTVECFLHADLSRELGLDRDTLIRLAYLLGSDYTEGIPGIGPVVAMELLREFPGPAGLHQFREWWSRVQSGKDTDEDNRSKFRRQFKKRHKDLYISSDWPNSEVRDAYYHPIVDSSEEPFKWGLPDLDGLRQFFRQELGWKQNKVDELLLPIIQKINKRNQAAALNRQGNLNDFFSISSGSGTHAPRQRNNYASKRLQQVVSDFRLRQRNASTARESPPTSGSELQQHNDKKSDADSLVKKRKRRTTTNPGRGKAKAARRTSRRASRAESTEDMTPDEDKSDDEEEPNLQQQPPSTRPVANRNLRPKSKPAYRSANTQVESIQNAEEQSG